MRDTGSRLRLAQEAFSDLGVVGQVAPQRLERERATEPHVAHAVHAAHPALADQRLDLVAMLDHAAEQRIVARVPVLGTKQERGVERAEAPLGREVLPAARTARRLRLLRVGERSAPAAHGLVVRGHPVAILARRPCPWRQSSLYPRPVQASDVDLTSLPITAQKALASDAPRPLRVLAARGVVPGL